MHKLGIGILLTIENIIQNIKQEFQVTHIHTK